MNRNPNNQHQMLIELQETNREQQEQNLIREFKQKHCSQGKNPLQDAGWFSRLLFNWMVPKFELGSQTTFQQEYHYNLRKMDRGETCYNSIREEWVKYHPNWVKDPTEETSVGPLLKSVVKAYQKPILVFFVLSLVLAVIEFLNIKIVEMALKSMEEHTEGITKVRSAGVLIFTLIGFQVTMCFLREQNTFLILLVQERIKHGLNGLIFEKVSKKSIKRDPTFSMGEITNLSQADVEKLCKVGDIIRALFVSPIQILVGIGWLFFLVGPMMIFNLAFLIVLVFINLFILMNYAKYKANHLSLKDKRGKIITELFTNIRFIKMNALENYFLKKVQKVKTEELRFLNSYFKINVDSMVFNTSIPLLFIFVIFGTYLLTKGMFTVSFVFTVMMIYDVVKKDFPYIPLYVMWMLDFFVSGRRLTFFLLSDNICTSSYIERVDAADESDYCIEVTNGSFYWEDADLRKCHQAEKDRISQKPQNPLNFTKNELGKIQLRAKITNEGFSGWFEGEGEDSTNQNANSIKGFSGTSQRPDPDFLESLMAKELLQDNLYQGIHFNLKNINLNIRKGACVGIIGSIGSGKSSLLSCLSGEMYQKLDARIKLVGTTAYVSQKAWIPSMTVKENILFGAEFDQQRYEDCINFSCMTRDLEILAKGDNTLLGEQGINMSGGQKVRLSIARAMYSDSDIYLFDDPISALDIHVGKFVMEEGIVGYLKGKTRVVATHAVGYLKNFDYIYIMEKGEIVVEGEYDQISKTAEFQAIKKADEERKKKQEEEKQEQEKKNNKRDKIIFEDEEEGKAKGEKNDSNNSFQQINNADRVQEKSLMEVLKDPLPLKNLPELNNSGEHSLTIRDMSQIKDPSQSVLIDDIIESEDRVKGVLSLKIVKNWINLSGGYFKNIIMISFLIPWSFGVAGIPWFLQHFVEMDSVDDMDAGLLLFFNFAWRYLAIFVLQQIGYFGFLRILFSNSMKMSMEVNFNMTFSTVHASVNKYFDRIPAGRLLNRFIKDVEVLDENVPFSLTLVLVTSFMSITTFVVSASTTSVVVVFIVIFYIFVSFKIQRYYMNLTRELTRLNAISSSPILQKLKENLEGVSSIRFYEKKKTQFGQYNQKVDDYQKNLIALKGALGWFNVRVCLLSLIVIIPTIIISLFFVKMKVGVFGLMLNFLLMTTDTVNELLKSYGDNENNLISLERCCSLMEVAPEAGYKDLDKLQRLLRDNQSDEKQAKSLGPKKAKSSSKISQSSTDQGFLTSSRT